MFTRIVVGNSRDTHCTTGAPVAWKTRFLGTESDGTVHVCNTKSDEEAKHSYKRSPSRPYFCGTGHDVRTDIG